MNADEKWITQSLSSDFEFFLPDNISPNSSNTRLRDAVDEGAWLVFVTPCPTVNSLASIDSGCAVVFGLNFDFNICLLYRKLPIALSNEYAGFKKIDPFDRFLLLLVAFGIYFFRQVMMESKKKRENNRD